MPNWCENELTIKGKLSEVKRLKEFVKGEEELLEADKIIPYPRELKLLDEKSSGERELAPEEILELTLKGFDLSRDGFNQGGYEWCNHSWGTKWGFCRSQILDQREDERKMKLIYSFDTAWSPPGPLILKLAELFPKLELTLRYWEGGMGFRGFLKVKGQKVISYWHKPYKGNRGG